MKRSAFLETLTYGGLGSLLPFEILASNYTNSTNSTNAQKEVEESIIKGNLDQNGEYLCLHIDGSGEGKINCIFNSVNIQNWEYKHSGICVQYHAKYSVLFHVKNNKARKITVKQLRDMWIRKHPNHTKDIIKNFEPPKYHYIIFSDESGELNGELCRLFSTFNKERKDSRYMGNFDIKKCSIHLEDNNRNRTKITLEELYALTGNIA